MDLSKDAHSALCQMLGMMDTSIGFLLVIIASVLLSFQNATIQRAALCRSLRTGRSPEVDTTPLSRRSGAMVVGALGFFLCLALNTHREAACTGDAAARRSAWTNLLASGLVLTAAILRLNDLNFVSHHRQQLLESGTALSNSVLPD